jgi:hypothetical protein
MGSIWSIGAVHTQHAAVVFASDTGRNLGEQGGRRGIGPDHNPAAGFG